MNEVSCRACSLIVEAVRAGGRAPDELVEGLPFTFDDLTRPSNRIAWDDFAVFLERAAGLLGGGEQLEALAAAHARSTGILRALASNFTSVRPVYLLGAKWYGPSIFSNTRASCDDLPDGRIRVTVEILPGYRDSEEFFRAMRGMLRATPSVLGQPDALVEMELHPRRAVYTIAPPPSLTLWKRIRRAFSRGSTIAESLQELTVHHQEVQQSYERERAVSAKLAAQSRQLETLNELGRDLARHIDVGEFAESLMKLFQDHFRFDGVALWLTPPEEGELELVHRVGETSGESTQRCALEMTNRVVGRLDLWESEASVGSETRELLAELLPWIALALHNARSFDALQRQTRRLEEEIAERKRAEQQLHQAQKMEALGHLAGGLAHDFNNMLTAIGGYAELAREKLDENDPVRCELDEIIAASERASGLIKQVLAFSRRQMLLPQRLDLNSVILGMETMLRRLIGENIELVIVAAPDLGLVMADPGQFEQIIVNLVVNSRDALPGGGRITIETSNVEAREIDAGAAPPPRPGRYVRLGVRDTGVGMDAETRSRLFEPFFTTKPRGEGTGLGLSTVYGIVTQSGGSVGVESAIGEGAAITIYLPRVEGEPNSLEVFEPEREVAGGKETLLLVEDEESVRTVARRILEDRGYTVLTARHGEEALAICESHAGSIDLLLTDVVMPRLDGRELARRLGPLRPELRGVIYMSGYANDDIGTDGPLPLERVFLRKPFRKAALLDAVRHALDAPIERP